MKHISLGIALAVSTISLAQAQGINITVTNTRAPIGDIIRQDMLRPPSAAIIHVPQSMSAREQEEKAARIRKWEAFCEPKLKTREYGVQYYVYKHKDCEFGRSE